MRARHSSDRALDALREGADNADNADSVWRLL